MAIPIAAAGLIAQGIGSSIDLTSNVLGLGYNAWLNQNMWNREDNAVQRRVADLKAAGLSPTLAAGSAAQSGQPIKVSGDMVPKLGGAVQDAINGVRTLSEVQLLNQQVKKQELENAFLEKWQPLKIRQEAVQTAIDERSMEDRLVDIKQTAKGKGLQNRIRVLDARLQEKGLRQADVDYTIALLRQRILKKEDAYKLSNLEIELLAKELAIDTAQHNLDQSRIFGLRTTDRSPDISAFVRQIGRSFEGLDPKRWESFTAPPQRRPSRFQIED